MQIFEWVLIYIAIGSFVWAFLPAIVTVLEYPFRNDQRSHKETLDSFNDLCLKDPNKNTIAVLGVVLFPIVLVFLLFRIWNLVIKNA